MINNICIITNGYPTKEDPYYAFIRPLVCGLADRNIKCTVIAPQSLSHIVRKGKRKITWTDFTDSGNRIEVLQPIYPSFSKLRVCKKSLTTLCRDIAIKTVYKKYITCIPDLIYAHFWDCGIVGSCLGSKDIPLIVACGESKITVKEKYPISTIEHALLKVKGVISVSTENLNESKDLGLIHDSIRAIVLPNAVDTSSFKQLSKKEIRKELGIDSKDIVACYVGAFIPRKGVQRVIQAAKSVDRLKLILIGEGAEIESDKQIIFKGTVSHDKIPVYLNASDMFVLPTLAEGCCNAIVEALACGLPIVSSDLPFNEDILNAGNSILIDPNDIEQISNAMKTLAENDSLRESMGREALRSANSLSIEQRVDKVVDFMNSLLLY